MKVSIDTRSSVYGPQKRETVAVDKELGFRIVDAIILDLSMTIFNFFLDIHGGTPRMVRERASNFFLEVSFAGLFSRI